MENFQHAKKQIVVGNNSGHIIDVLKGILSSCKRKNYVVATIDEFDSQDSEVLLLCDSKEVEFAKNFSVCVVDYGLAALPALEGTKLVTYSTTSDSADFTAKNIRKISEGFATFEIIGVGVIGRVKLAISNNESIRCVLAATTASIACGIPFAKILDVLNKNKIVDL